MTRWCWLLLGCLLPATALAEDKFGRLFFTPAERVSLDNLRHNGRAPMVSTNEDDVVENDGEVSPPANPVVSVGGYVKRSDGKTTVWVNGRPVDESAADGEVRLGKMRRNSNSVPIRLPGSGQVIELKPGQSFDPVSGRVIDGTNASPNNAVQIPVAPKAMPAPQPFTETPD